MAAFFELILFAIVGIGVIAVGNKTGKNGASNNTSRTRTIRCPSCGSPAKASDNHWECPYCGDSGGM